MGNLSLCDNAVKTATLNYWAKKCENERERLYLGASSIGHECDKYLWLGFRGTFNETFPPRILRLFDRGDREEQVFVDELRGTGCEVWDVNPETGLQWEVKACGGHFSGHMDGIATGIPGAPRTPHMLEFKTHNDASFSKLVKVGVEVAKPQHYAQMQIYMGLMKLTRALYCAVNKNTDETYFERVEFNAQKFKALGIRAKRIIEASEVERYATRPDDFRCKFCGAKDVCWHTTGTILSVEDDRPIDCRTCCHATAKTDAEGAQWHCVKGLATTIGKPCNCSIHLALPTLIDANLMGLTSDNEAVLYAVEEFTFANGRGDGQYSTEELQKASIEVLKNPAVTMAKEVLGATITKTSPVSFVDEYPTIRSLWSGNKAGVREAFKSIKFKVAPKMTAEQEDNESKFFEYNNSVLVCIGKLGDFASIFRK